MILKRFVQEDAPWIQENIYPNLTIPVIEEMIGQWNSGMVEGRFFEILAICSEGEICGTVSLYEQEDGTVSFGIKVIPKLRRMAIGTKAGLLAIERAGMLGYQVMVSQVRQDNAASNALHRKLGFQKTAQIMNRKGNPVFLYQKQIQ